MDDNAQTAAQEAQDAQNTAILAFLKLIANLIGQASERDVKLEDLTLMSGTKKAWPSDNPDLELTAKIQDAFTNPDSKASVRIFLEYPDGSKEEIFRQTAGKVIKDPLGLAPAMREMIAQQALDKFTAPPPSPKVKIEVDSLVNAVEPIQTDSLTSTQERSFSLEEENELNVQALQDELEKSEQLLQRARQDLNSPKYDPEKVLAFIKFHEEKVQSLRAQLGLAEPIVAAESVNSVAQEDEQIQRESAEEKTFNSSTVSLKEQILKGQLAEVEATLSETKEQAMEPGLEYLLDQQWFKDLEQKAHSLREELGITQAGASIEQLPNNQAMQDLATFERDQTQADNIDEVHHQNTADVEAEQVGETSNQVAETASLQSNQERHQNFILDAIASSQISDLAAVSPTASLDEAKPEVKVQPSIGAFEPSPTIQEKNEMFVMGAIASSVSPGGMAVQDSPALATVPNAKPIVYESWVPAFPELAEVSTLANYEGQTLDITPVDTSSSDLAAPSDIDRAFNNVSIQPFLAEITQLSAEIESLRAQTNQKLSELAAFSVALKETVIDPKIEQWSQQTIAVVETQAVSLGDRLKNAATHLRDTVKERAANDWKIVVDTVKDRASEDWTKTVDVVKGRASNDLETVQKWAIGAEKVEKGIDTLIDYVGQKHPNGGMAQMDGYTFIHKNGQTGIFKDNSTEPVYKNGLLTGKASPKDAAYIAQLPQKAKNAAAAVDAYKASQAAQSSAAPSQSQGGGVPRKR